MEPGSDETPDASNGVGGRDDKDGDDASNVAGGCEDNDSQAVWTNDVSSAIGGESSKSANVALNMSSLECSNSWEGEASGGQTLSFLFCGWLPISALPLSWVDV